ncbi:MAG TPA: hypothetical protein VHB20_15505 [Verrucomicrobiae bacterium]|jgi:hypothetical protein|nr:hypothetical protein [Verrucomicrobiae bacterium]
MKLHRPGLCCALFLAALSSQASVRNWTNTLGGDWNGPSNWSPNGVPNVNDTANVSADGVYTVTMTSAAVFNPAALRVGGGAGAQTLLVDGGATLTLTNAGGLVTNNGILVLTNGSFVGALTVDTNAQLVFTGPTVKFLYSFSLVSRGIVSWNDGAFYIGGTPTTTISNGGTWQIACDNTFNYGGGATPTWTNNGVIRKIAGTGATYFSGFNFVNLPGGTMEADGGVLQFSGGNSNVLGGTMLCASPAVLNISGGVWTDAGATASGTGLIQLTSGTLNLRTNVIPGLKLAGGDIYIVGTTNFQQAGVITNLNLDGATLHGTNFIDNGMLTMTSGSLVDRLTVSPHGTILFNTPTSKALYTATIINQGTVSWADGMLYVGGTPPTTIINSGTWDVQSDVAMVNGGGLTALWTNSGLLNKSGGTGAAQLSGFNFYNISAGLVHGSSGTLQFSGGNSNVLGGIFAASAPGVLEIANGTWTDGGGVAGGNGVTRFNNGIFNFRFNTIPGLLLTGGTVYVTGAGTFQEAGAITNLALDGATLAGTNVVGHGAVTLNSGGITGQLTVSSAGQWTMATAATKFLYGLTVINKGTVNWGGGSLYCGSTPTTIISNGGLWVATTDDAASWGGGPLPVWTNTGTLRKAAGSGVTSVAALDFHNMAGGLVQADTGTIQLPVGDTIVAGTLRANGGALAANGTLLINGGVVDGSGSIGVSLVTGGLISPGVGGPGRLSFTSGLNLGPSATVSLDGVGTVPGSQYDQLAVTGAVSLGGAQLQVVSLPTVAPGTTFVIITNDAIDPVVGTFQGLPENATLTISGQLFRIHYAGGHGNDVTLVRGAIPSLAPEVTLDNGALSLSGSGTPSGRLTIQASTNLSAWTNIAFVTNDGGGNFAFTDTNAFRFHYRFYRVAE